MPTEMTFAEMLDRFAMLAGGGLVEDLQQLGTQTAETMVQRAQANAASRLTMHSYALYDSIRATPEPLDAGLQVPLTAGGSLDSAHAVYQELGFADLGTEGGPLTYPGVYYLRDAFTDSHAAVPGQLLDLLTASLT